jgi:GDPmannose 4,6-dehydratase
LHSKGYEVFGLLRGQSNARREALEAEFPFTNLIEADLTDQTSLIQAVGTSAPTEIYNLGAISHVGYSFRNPQLTTDITAKGVLNPLEAMRITGFDRKSRFYS